MKPAVAARASSVEWYTPPEVFEALGVTFDLDPAAPAGGVPWVPTRRWLSRRDDGLRQPWAGRVWLNPPYGRQTGAWLDRLVAHGDGLALVFARTDVKWFHRALAQATAVCFIAGRLRFHSPQGAAQSAPAPSVLLSYGLPSGLILASCDLGQTIGVPNQARVGAVS